MKELVKENLKVIERKEGQIYIGKKQRKMEYFIKFQYLMQEV